MSSLSLCDGNDCYKTENDCEVHHVDDKVEKFLKMYCSNWMNGSYDDICQDCIDSVNEDYQEFFIFDEYDGLCISDKYLQNPELLKEKE